MITLDDHCCPRANLLSILLNSQEHNNYNLTRKNIITEKVYKAETFKRSGNPSLKKGIILERLKGLTLDCLSMKPLKLIWMLGQNPKHSNKERIEKQ